MCEIFIQFCCHCFGYCFKRHPYETHSSALLNNTKILSSTKNDDRRGSHSYTVHKISSFGKSRCNGDDADDPFTNSNDKSTSHGYINKDVTTWSNKLNKESISDYEEKGSRSLRTSPISKKKGHWGKALLRAKKDNATTDKGLSSFQSLAGVSMVMLPTITVASSSATTAVGNLVGRENAKDTLRKRTDEGTLRPLQPLIVPPSPTSCKTASTWLKSQSMLNVNCISDNESELEDIKGNNSIARKFGLDTSLYNSCRLSKSMEAVNKVWKSVEDCANSNTYIDLAHGTLHFTASYNKVNKKLFVRIEKIEGLAPKGRDKQKYDCVLKLSILPSEKHVKFSKVIPAHCSLNIDESFVFTTKCATSKVLRLTVYDVHKQGKYESVGHALFYIEDALTNDHETRVMKLYKQSAINNGTTCNLQVTLSYDKCNELLNVTVVEADNLPTSSGKCKVYLKLLYYNHGKRVREVSSPSIILEKHVSFYFNSDFKLSDSAIDDTYLVVAVKVKGFLKKDTLVGRLILGPFFYAEYGQKLTPWGRALLTGQSVSHTFITYL